MTFRLYKMDRIGKVAFANMMLIVLALVVVLIAVHARSDGWNTPGGIAWLVSEGLGLPLSLIAMLFDTTCQPSETAFILRMIFLPINAYLWGHVVDGFIVWRSKRG